MAKGSVFQDRFYCITFSGIATTLAVDILKIPQLNTLALSKALEWAFLSFLPNFCLGQGLSVFYDNYEFLSICNNTVVQESCKYSSKPNPCCPGETSANRLKYQNFNGIISEIYPSILGIIWIGPSSIGTTGQSIDCCAWWPHLLLN